MGADERDRILGLLEAGRITADQAAVLLDAVGAPRPGGAERSGATRPAEPPRPKPPAQSVRIRVQAFEHGEAVHDVDVAVPIALARFAARFLPKEARAQLEAQGVDVEQLLAGLGDEVPDGPLIDIDTKDASGATSATIRVEVV